MEKKKRVMKRNRICREVLAVCLALAALSFRGVQAWAGEDHGSLTIYLNGRTETGETAILADACFCIHKAADMTEGKWTLTDDLEKTGVCLEDMSASVSMENAQILYDCVRENEIQGEQAMTGANGSVHFDNLEEGLYLVCQEGDCVWETEDERITFRSAPFLISIPEDIGGESDVWDVSARPKTEWSSYTHLPDDKGETPDSDEHPDNEGQDSEGQPDNEGQENGETSNRGEREDGETPDGGEQESEEQQDRMGAAGTGDAENIANLLILSVSCIVLAGTVAGPRRKKVR